MSRELKRLARAEETAQLMVCHAAFELDEAEKTVERLKFRMRESLNDLAGIRNEIRTTKADPKWRSR